MAAITLDHVRRALRGHEPTTDDAPGAAPAAVALMLSEGAEGVELLLIHRAARHGDPWSGHIGLPGGMHTPADPNLLVTAVRETHEELGVDLRGVLCLAQLSDLRPRVPVLPPVYVRPFVFALRAVPPLTLSAEVQETFWVPLHRLSTPEVRREVTIPLPGPDRPVPAFLIGERVIWGMTERIVTGFLDLVA